MNIRTKQLYELKGYINSLTNKYHAKYTNQVRGIMYNIKHKGNLTDEELGLILGIPGDAIEAMLHETWDGHVSTKLAIKLQLLSCGMFGLPGCKMLKDEIDTTNDHFTKILCPVADDPQERTKSSSETDAMDLILSIFDGDPEFQKKIREKWREHQAKGEEIFQEIVKRYQEAKDNIQDTTGLREATKILSNTAKTLLTKIIEGTDGLSAPSQECGSDDAFKDKSRKISDKSETAKSSGRNVNQGHESDAEDQSGFFVTYQDEGGKINHISINIDDIKKWMSSDKPNSPGFGKIMDFLLKVVK